MFERGIVPDEWKIAKVIKIFKPCGKQQASNYRSGSPFCSCSKGLENCLFHHFMTHFEINAFICDQLHGFRHEFLKVTWLLHTLNVFANVADKGGQIKVIFLDFAKAFV